MNPFTTTAARLAAHLERKQDAKNDWFTCLSDASLKDMDELYRRAISDILQDADMDKASAYE